MIKPYSKDELWRIYEKLPQELKKAVFSNDTAEDIFNTCQRHDVNNVADVATYAGYVLMGLILPQDFPKTLEQDAKLSPETAGAVSQDLNRLVFYPVKPALEQLHRIEIEVTAKVVTPQPQEEGQPEEQEPEQKPRGEDTYREPLE